MGGHKTTEKVTGKERVILYNIILYTICNMYITYSIGFCPSEIKNHQNVRSPKSECPNRYRRDEESPRTCTRRPVDGAGTACRRSEDSLPQKAKALKIKKVLSVVQLLSSFSFVGVPGLEPGKAGPESAVLPLHHTPIVFLEFRALLLRFAGAKVRLFL